MGLTEVEQLTMLDAARDAGPPDKRSTAEDYVFLMLFEQRQGALAFVSLAVGALYSLSLALDERAPLHLVFAVMAALFALVNANQAVIRGLGHHPACRATVATSAPSSPRSGPSRRR